MSNEDALKHIKEALELASPGSAEKVSADTHLVDDDILDSLDLMNFMFELEEIHGSKIEQVTETFDDYRVSTLVSFISG